MSSEPTASHDNPDAVRMTIGEHLDELRICVSRSLIALVVSCIVCIWPAKYLLAVLTRPVVMALRRNGQPESFLATSPTEAMLIYIKVVVVFGLILAAPYIIRQIWAFVAAGLYKREKQWAYRLVPVSVGLFMVGVAFMYFLVLLVSLNFLIHFGTWLKLPSAEPTPFEGFLLGGPPPVQAVTSQPTSMPSIPLLDKDPTEPITGALWFNVSDGKLKLRGGNETYTTPLVPGEHPPLVTSHFRLGEYIEFVLIMMIAFGVAFQMPLVVVFLVRSGIASVKLLKSYRKVVILVIVIIAGILAPPDLSSHLLLSGPMILLFELGLLVAARKQKPATA